MTSGQVVARRSVERSGRLVGQVERKARPSPLVPQPVLHRQLSAVDREGRFLDILDTYLRHNWKLAEREGVRISGDVPFAFVPDMAITVLPSICSEQGRVGARTASVFPGHNR